MKIDDLRTELATLSRAVHAGAQTNRLASVHGRIRERRRARVVAVAGAAAIAVAAVVIAPVLADEAAPKGATPIFTQRPTRTDSYPAIGKFTFASSRDGNPLSATFLADQGVGVIEQQVILDKTLHVEFAQLCRVTSPDATLGAEVRARVAVNGRVLGAISCASHDTAGAAAMTIGAEEMRDHGVRLGRPFTLGMTATRRHGETVDIDRMGFGLYEQVVPTVRAGGVDFQTLHGDGDAQERIVRHATVPVAQARVLRLSVPASDEPRSIAYGWEGAASSRGRVDLRVDGTQAPSLWGVPTSSYAPSVLKPGVPHQVTLRLSGDDRRGTLLLGVYAPVDTSTS